MGKGKKLKNGPPKGQAPVQFVGRTGRDSVASDSGGKLARFFKSQFFLVFASIFIVLMTAAAWLVYRPQMVRVVLAVGLLALTMGGLFWLRKMKDKPDDRRLNETHDRHDVPEGPQEEPASSLITQVPPAPPAPVSPTNMSSESAAWAADVQRIKDAFRSLAEKMNGLESRLAELEQHLYFSQSPRTKEEIRPVVTAPTLPSPRRSASDYSVAYRESQPRPSSISLPSLSQDVCRFLENQTGGWELDRLLQSLGGSRDGNASVEVEHLVPYNSGGWRLVALWPQHSQEGLVLVSSGELVDDDIAKYFDVSYGRRIISCKQPARVVRSGVEVAVLQKGKVESS